MLRSDPAGPGRVSKHARPYCGQFLPILIKPGRDEWLALCSERGLSIPGTNAR